MQLLNSLVYQFLTINVLYEPIHFLVFMLLIDYQKWHDTTFALHPTNILFQQFLVVPLSRILIPTIPKDDIERAKKIVSVHDIHTQPPIPSKISVR